jgi:ATP-dependent DNA helicase DinG
MDSIISLVQAFVLYAAAKAGFEERPQQKTFAEAVRTAFSSKRTLMAKAPTGVGKSAGYLIPIILELQANKAAIEAEEAKLITGEELTFEQKRYIITTANKALQNQLMYVDLPQLHDIFGGFTYGMLKGRTNYVCLNKLDSCELSGIEVVQDHIETLLEGDWNGEVETIGIELSEEITRAIRSDDDSCEDHTSGCFYYETKTESWEQDILVVNHASWVTDISIKLKTDGKAHILGEYHDVVVDEAHQLEEFATGVIGEKVTHLAIHRLMKKVITFAGMLPAAQKTKLVSQANIIDGESEKFFNALPTLDQYGNARRLTKDELDSAGLAGLSNLMDSMYDAVHPSGLVDLVHESYRKDAKKLHKALAKGCKGMTQRLDVLLTSDYLGDTGFVRVLQREGGLSLYAKPISVAQFMHDAWFSSAKNTSVLVSATLPFDYISGRIGVKEYTTLEVDSPFDFSKQGLLYVPSGLPTTKFGYNRAPELAPFIEELILAANGGALVLFTSNKVMNDVWDLIAPNLRNNGLTLLKQGDAPNPELTKQFRENEDWVLFGTKSFMTGVDFSGRTCRMVILDKLPYPIQTDPVIAARCDSINDRFGDQWAMMDGLMKPEMLISLDQAMGRLIRRSDDSGVVAILDPRMLGTDEDRFLNALPPFRPTNSMKRVRKFFGMTG